MLKRNRLVRASLALTLVFAFGLAFAPAAGAQLFISGPTPVYRFYNQGTGGHFYTISEEEMQSVLAKYSGVFTYEGIAYYVPDPTAVQPAGTGPTGPTVPLYRFYNTKNGSHFYTISAAERDRVIATYSGTFVYEGIAYQVWDQSSGDAMPVYRFYNKLNGSHFYTISEVEANIAKMKLGAVYTYEGVAFYAWPWYMRAR
ncbi:MAG: hypothetical protein EG823_04410 [Actinobacteria bacterium]|nr:hypothetical protein [Actinomycetota bacterium]